MNAGDLLGDVLGGLSGLAGKALHLVRHDGKAFSGFTGAGRLDRGVQSQQVRLAGDVADKADYLAEGEGLKSVL